MLAVLWQRLSESTGSLPITAEELAAVIDRNADGVMSFTEFADATIVMSAVHAVNGKHPQARSLLARAMFGWIDQDGDGLVKEAELASWLVAATSLGLVPQPDEDDPTTPRQAAARLIS